MAQTEKKQAKTTYVKVVYFDEDSASDLVDLDAGGRQKLTETEADETAKEAEGKISASFAAKYGWFSFLGARAEAAGNASISKAGSKIIEKSLSNTVLTDYLERISAQPYVETISKVTLAPVDGSMAHVKMFTPFMVIANTAESGIDLGKLDEALTQAKGYYELIATNFEGDNKRILRFNLKAFRNNYGLNDLCRMDLQFDCIKVGEGSLESLRDEFGTQDATTFSASLLLKEQSERQLTNLDVYDVILAGVTASV